MTTQTRPVSADELFDLATDLLDMAVHNPEGASAEDLIEAVRLQAADLREQGRRVDEATEDEVVHSIMARI